MYGEDVLEVLSPSPHVTTIYAKYHIFGPWKFELSIIIEIEELGNNYRG